MAKRTLHIPANMAGLRLDQALTALVPDLSRRGARALIQAGAVYLGGRRCRTASKFVQAGVQVGLEESLHRRQRAALVDISILWEGEGILALDKPAGVPFAPTRSAVEGSVLHALARRLGRPMNQLHPVHRLDTPTSGVVLVALTAKAAGFLGDALVQGRVRKTYLAWAASTPGPPEGEWTWPLSSVEGGRVRVDVDGRPATSLYRILDTRGGESLLELRPLTGRTHQLRAHCAAARCPIVGDKAYGGPLTAHRALLHAWRIVFPLPGGGEQAVEAPVPEDMKREQGAGSREQGAGSR